MVAEKQIKLYKQLLNNHTKELGGINISKNCLFIYKPPINIKVIFFFTNLFILKEIEFYY